MISAPRGYSRLKAGHSVGGLGALLPSFITVALIILVYWLLINQGSPNPPSTAKVDGERDFNSGHRIQHPPLSSSRPSISSGSGGGSGNRTHDAGMAGFSSAAAAIVVSKKTAYTGGSDSINGPSDFVRTQQQQQQKQPGSARLNENDGQYDEEDRMVQVAEAARVKGSRGAGGAGAAGGMGANPEADAEDGGEELLLYALIQDSFDALCLPYKDRNNLVRESVGSWGRR